MHICYMVYCGEFQGSIMYVSAEEAQKRADMLSAMTGRKWKVRRIIVK